MEKVSEDASQVCFFLGIMVLLRTIQILSYAEEVDVEEKQPTEMICCSFSKFQEEPSSSCQ